MDDLTRRAMLGDREAQEELTKQGKLLPCQCGGAAVVDDGNPVCQHMSRKLYRYLTRES